MLRHDDGTATTLFLHGGSPQEGSARRWSRRFQNPATRTHPILIVLSLKAGGVGPQPHGRQRTSFHFDRWWNPAVENQATDRAYRIGQTRTVHVHKFVVSGHARGTHRRDDRARRPSWPENIIGSGERWLTELDTDQLRQILSLRNESIGVDTEE